MISVDKNLVEIELNIIQIYKINTIINLQISIKYSLKNNRKKRFYNGIMLQLLAIQEDLNQVVVCNLPEI